MSEDAFWSGQLVEENDQPWQWYDANRYAEKSRKKKRVDPHKAAIAAFKALPKGFSEKQAYMSPAVQSMSEGELVYFVRLIKKEIKWRNPTRRQLLDRQRYMNNLVERKTHDRAYYAAHRDKVLVRQKAAYDPARCKRNRLAETTEKREMQYENKRIKYKLMSDAEREYKRAKERAGYWRRKDAKMMARS